MTFSLTVTSPPKRTQSPLTFQAEHSEAVPRRAALARSAAACSTGQASPSPPPQRPSAPCQGAGQRPALRLQEATAQSPAFWASADTSLPALFHTTQSARIILERERSRGEQSLSTGSRGEQGKGKSICLSVSQHFPLQQME